MKTCSQCNQPKALNEFAIQSTGRMGRRADCKMCVKRFTRSIDGVILSMYAMNKYKAKRRGHQPPTYTQQELRNWVMAQPNYLSMHKAWEIAGYPTALRPSIDRLDDYRSYTLNNIQLLTVQENIDKYNNDRLLGVNTKATVAVDMLDLEGNFIKRFYSVSEAARQFNGIPSNIIGVCTGRVTRRKEKDGSIRLSTTKKAYGYKWRYSLLPNKNGEII